MVTWSPGEVLAAIAALVAIIAAVANILVVDSTRSKRALMIVLTITLLGSIGTLYKVGSMHADEEKHKAEASTGESQNDSSQEDAKQEAAIVGKPKKRIPSAASESQAFPGTKDDSPYLTVTEGSPKRIASIPATVSVTFHTELGGYASLNIAVDGREPRVESILGKGGEISVETANGERRLDVIDLSLEQHKLTLSVR